MNQPSDQKRAEWVRRAALKHAIVPEFFEVFPTRVIIVCGRCRTRFVRNLVPNQNEPTFVCPEAACRAKNWVPITFAQK